MVEQNERHLRQLNRMHRLNERKWKQDARLEMQNNYTIALTNRETTLVNKFDMLELRRTNLNTAWSIHMEELVRMETILKEELDIVINREVTITNQEITVVETVRELAVDMEICPMVDSETPVVMTESH
jgi:glutathione synthase/RimK-type ligase-like ATP-grasp enzyme